MSRFFSEKHCSLIPYEPGEQPRNTKYIKLNTNESPFPVSKLAVKGAAEAAKKLQLYSDPTCFELTQTLSKLYGVDGDEILFTNGSDEILNFAFMAFCDETHPAAFPDITYGFYHVFARLNHVPFTEIPLMHDFSVNIMDYKGLNKTIFLANPNAPTGIALTVSQIEEIVASNPKSVVVIDEAYVDFGAESAVGLIRKYDNLLVTQTFSKSRSMAGARLGFGIGCKSLIQDLNTVKYSTNPYNVNSMTMAAGIGVLSDDDYTHANCKTIIGNRESAKAQLKKLGFTVTDSSANFLFAKHSDISGAELYGQLKERGVLVRHFHNKKMCEYNRITVGTAKQMKVLTDAIKEILEEIK